MVRFFRDSGLPSRRAREAARQRRRSERQQDLKLESLEPRLALAVTAGLPDTVPPVVRSVVLPTAGTYGTGKALTFKVNFSEPVKIAGDQSAVTLPVEVGYAMHEARYVSGSGTKSLTFRMTVAANDVDTDGISVGRVNSAAIRDFDFNKIGFAPRIVDRAGNPASNAIPALNTNRILVDATGPVVASFSAFVTSVVQGRQQVSLKVTFDGPVTVKGKPSVPVKIGSLETALVYAAGSGTNTLTFAVKLPKGEPGGNPAFRGDNGLPGEVILLPKDADLKDRFGNSVTPIGGNYGQTYTDNGTETGNRLVVIGTHYEKLKFGAPGQKVDFISKDELTTIMNGEQLPFRQDEADAVAKGEAKYWAGYAPPTFDAATNDVEVYRVAYRSTIPEQGNRPTVAYGLVAVPKGATGPLPLLSQQHGTLWLKESAPSQAFSWDKNATTPFKYGLSQQLLYGTCFETRLGVAQFAGHGYAMISADYFGIGNSVENDSFVVKKSQQQACLDMHAAAQKLFQSLGISTNKLFLNGWSEGALVSISFQEALEARGVKIDGVSTAATPANTGMFTEQFIFTPRPWSTENVPNAAWSIFVHQFSSFALASYSGQTNAPLELFGGNYDLSRKFYMREFAQMPSFEWRSDGRGGMEPVMVMDGVTTNTEVSRFLSRNVAQSPAAYERTAYAKLIADAGSGKTRLEAPMRMYYGEQDEGYAVPVCTIVDTWQRGTFGKNNIEQVPVPHASHRDTFLTATREQLAWFDDIRQGKPAPASAPPATPTLARSLPPQSPPIVAQSPPFVLPPAVGGIVEIAGDITSNVTFRAGTVYVITGEVHVRKFVTLTIEDGVEVRIRNGYENFATITSRALIFDSGSSLVAKNVTFQAANAANEPVNVADNGGVFFCGGTRKASKDDVSSMAVGASAAWSFEATRIVANYLGRKDPKEGDGDGSFRDDIDAVSLIGVIADEWKVPAVEINYSGDDGFDLTNSDVEMEVLKVFVPVEDGINLSSSYLTITKTLEVDMTDAENQDDREIFDFEVDTGPSLLTVNQGAMVDIRGFWDSSPDDHPVFLRSKDMPAPYPPYARTLYAWKGPLVKGQAEIFSKSERP